MNAKLLTLLVVGSALVMAAHCTPVDDQGQLERRADDDEEQVTTAAEAQKAADAALDILNSLLRDRRHAVAKRGWFSRTVKKVKNAITKVKAVVKRVKQCIPRGKKDVENSIERRSNPDSNTVALEDAMKLLNEVVAEIDA